MKNINLLSPDNPPEGEGSQNDELALGKKGSPRKTLRSLGLVLFLFLAFLLVRVLYQGYFADKQPVPSATKVPSLLPKKYKEVRREKPFKSVTQTRAETATPETVPQRPSPAKLAPGSEQGKAKVKPKPKLLQPVIPVEERKYDLLAGTFSSHKKAKAQLEKIRALGFKAHQQSIRVKQKVYMVYGGSKANYQSAKKLEKRLRSQGFDTYLPSSKTQKYRVRTGVFTHRNYAQELLRKLQAKGYKAQIETTQLPLLKYEIRLDNFKTYQAAKSQQNALQTKGIETILLLKQ